MDKYSPRERIEMTIAGEKPDRMPASFWRHFFHMEDHAEGTAEAMLHFQKTFGWDFMKINPRADYHVEEWGFRHEWSKDEFTKHKKLNFPIKKAEDWKNIKFVPPTAKALDEHLRAVSIIRKKSDKELPLLMTVFTPLAIMSRMVEDKRQFADQIKNNPDLILSALEEVTLTFEKFCEELRNAGADGLFLATVLFGSSDYLSWDDFKKFSVPYDLRLLKAFGEDGLNLLHVCTSNNYLKQIVELDYPVKMYNWESDDPTNIPLDIGLDLIKDKAVVGGVDHNGWLLHGTPPEVAYKIDELKEKHSDTKLIIGPGCAIDPKVPEDNLHAIKARL